MKRPLGRSFRSVLEDLAKEMRKSEDMQGKSRVSPKKAAESSEKHKERE